MYAVKHSGMESAVLEQCRRYRLPIPKHIQDAPELFTGLDLYYGAYFELDSCRKESASGAGPIGWDVIEFWAIRNALDADQAEDLQYYISRMDSAYLKYVRENGKSVK